MKEDEMGACSTHSMRYMKGVCKILVGKAEGKIPAGRPRRR
jgi:hypothetical protein